MSAYDLVLLIITVLNDDISSHGWLSKEIVSYHFILFSNVALTAITSTMLTYCAYSPKDGAKVTALPAVFVSCLVFIVFTILSFTSNTTTDFASLHSLVCLVLSVLIALIVFSLLRKIRNWAVEQPPYFRIARYKLPLDNRMVLIAAVWSLTFLLTSYFSALKFLGVSFVSDQFYSSWSVSVIFFTFMGFAVAAATLKLPHDEEFQARVGMLFSAPNLPAGSVSTALDYVGTEVRKLGFVVALSEREITVVEHDSKIQSYKVRVVSTTILRNLFGDENASDEMSIGYRSSNDFNDCGNDKPSQIGFVTSIMVDDKDELLSEAIPISSQTDYYNGLFSVSSDTPKKVQSTYWTWVRHDECMGLNPERFNETVRVTIRNSIENGKLDVQYEGTRGGAKKIYSVPFGKIHSLDDVHNKKPGEVFEYMKWHYDSSQP